jgi:enoyl-CoA hydratase
MTSDSGVVVDRPADGVLRIALDRPDSANALDDSAIEAIHHALDTAANEPACHALQLRSLNSYFCAGFDMAGYDGDPESRGGPAVIVEQMDRLADLPLRMRAARQVVIATVRGPASGGGFGLALGADILLAGTSATFQLPQTRLGVLATEMGLSYLLPRIVGLNRAADLMLRGGTWDAQTAERAGLVSEIWPDLEVDDAGLELAAQLTQRSANALRGTKRMLLAGLESSHLEATARAETQAQVLSNYCPDLRAAIARFKAEKR